MSESICIKKNLIDFDKPKLGNNFSFKFRSCNEEDAEQLGALYFESYDPGFACSSLEDATSDIKKSFAGEYGPFSTDYSLVIEDEENKKLIGAILVVEHNSWDENLKCPYIIELFVDRKNRREGYAKSLILESLEKIKNTNVMDVALTVSLNNKPALDLYKSLGFK